MKPHTIASQPLCCCCILSTTRLSFSFESKIRSACWECDDIKTNTWRGSQVECCEIQSELSSMILSPASKRQRWAPSSSPRECHDSNISYCSFAQRRSNGKLLISSLIYDYHVALLSVRQAHTAHTIACYLLASCLSSPNVVFFWHCGAVLFVTSKWKQKNVAENFHVNSLSVVWLRWIHCRKALIPLCEHRNSLCSAVEMYVLLVDIRLCIHRVSEISLYVARNTARGNGREKSANQKRVTSTEQIFEFQWLIELLILSLFTASDTAAVLMTKRATGGELN